MLVKCTLPNGCFLELSLQLTGKQMTHVPSPARVRSNLLESQLMCSMYSSDMRINGDVKRPSMHDPKHCFMYDNASLKFRWLPPLCRCQEGWRALVIKATRRYNRFNHEWKVPAQKSRSQTAQPHAHSSVFNICEHK